MFFLLRLYLKKGEKIDSCAKNLAEMYPKLQLGTRLNVNIPWWSVFWEQRTPKPPVAFSLTLFFLPLLPLLPLLHLHYSGDHYLGVSLTLTRRKDKWEKYSSHEVREMSGTNQRLSPGSCACIHICTKEQKFKG